MNLIDPDVPYSYGEGWLAFLRYQPLRNSGRPQKLMRDPVLTEYNTGNAVIRLEKNEAYCITSVQSPRKDTDYDRWVNLTLWKKDRM